MAGFSPQWASAPGESIAEVLSERGWTIDEFAVRLQEPNRTVEALLNGDALITIGLARKLHAVIGASVAFWMTRDLQYRKDLQRIREAAESWRRLFPVGELTRRGWLPTAAGSEVDRLLGFFDVCSVNQWKHQYRDVLRTANLRTSASFDSHFGALVAWIRQGQVVAGQASCAPWDPNALQKTLKEVRALTRIGKPERFLPKLREALARCGVAIALVPAPSGCRASGAALWLSADKGLVITSARHLSDDHLWFTVYHECAHLLLHRDTTVFVDDDLDSNTSTQDNFGSTAAEREKAANKFAEDVLIGQELCKALQHVPLTYRALLRLATKAGVAPGILVGQLQKSGRLAQDRLNRLKRRYQWVDGKLTSREKT